MISIQPTLLALALASLLFDVGLGREQLGAVQADPNRQYEAVTDAASCSAVGCEELPTVKACDAASLVLQNKKMDDYLPPRTDVVAAFKQYPSNCIMRNDLVFFNGNPGTNSAPSVKYPLICSCPANCRPTATCEEVQAIVNDKCGSNTGGSTSGGSNSGGSNSGGSNSGGSNSGGSNSGGSNSGGSNSGGSNSGGDSTSGGGGAGGDTPVNKLITDVTSQIDNNPEDPMVDLAGIYKLKDVEGWQKEGDCSAFKKDPAYLATELVKKLKDDLASIRL